jgi:aquaporin Z
VRDAIRRHWPEYLLEGTGLGLFMLAASAFAVLLFHPASPLGVGDPFVRRALMGLAMGATAVALIYSPGGRRSGAHLNPAVTLTFFRLGKIDGWDTVFYVVAQLVGGLAGMLVAVASLRDLLAAPSVQYVVTVPGPTGIAAAFLGELIISAVLMIVVLATSNSTRFARFTGLFAGTLVAVFITLEAPLSGMSMNPARTVASATPAGIWTAWWLYVAAPALGMLAAAEFHAWSRRPVRCAKLHHSAAAPCIFRCGYGKASS